MSTLERAIAIAATAHAGQRDKGGSPYILHPLRVMLRLSTDEERIVGALHDVMEDCHITREMLLAEGFSEEVVAGVESVSRRDGETYHDFVLRAAANRIGRRVKRMDLEENSDLSRIPDPTQRDHDRTARYRKFIALIDALPPIA